MMIRRAATVLTASLMTVALAVGVASQAYAAPAKKGSKPKPAAVRIATPATALVPAMAWSPKAVPAATTAVQPTVRVWSYAVVGVTERNVTATVRVTFPAGEVLPGSVNLVLAGPAGAFEVVTVPVTGPTMDLKVTAATVAEVSADTLSITGVA